MKKNGKIQTADLCYVAVFTAILAVTAQISIPLPGGVPLTLQTFAVPLAGLVLGAKRGAASSLLYVLLAAVGVPVLAGMKGGIAAVFGMTGGFLLSFPLMAWLAGRYAARGIRSVAWWMGLIMGALVNYAVGTLWFMLIAHTGLSQALMACVVPFLPTAVLKLVLAGLVGSVLRSALRRAGLLLDKNCESC
ncbi:MAG: biotin transporter BioY [Lachnospiraceae bacterium]|nr:biotin transporter BioY [Lachnospiraceae bacterium]